VSNFQIGNWINGARRIDLLESSLLAYKKAICHRDTCFPGCDTQPRQRGKVISSGYTFLSESFALDILFTQKQKPPRRAFPREDDIIYRGYMCARTVLIPGCSPRAPAGCEGDLLAFYPPRSLPRREFTGKLKPRENLSPARSRLDASGTV
jgi:hypothetical protein